MKDRLKYQYNGFLFTPLLWQNTELFDLQQISLPLLRDKSADDILFLQPSLKTNFVLGKRIESFFEIAIQDSKEYQVLAHNLQIQKEKRTIGELDFILRDIVNQKDFHLELMYKFYVYDPSYSSELERWIGPNRKDSLLEKVDKVKQKQLPLLYKPETAQVLNSLDIINDLSQKVCFKANLFVPRDLLQSKFEYVNNQCITGYWIHLMEFNNEEFGDSLFYTPKKQDWPIDPKFGSEWVNFNVVYNQILEMFEKEKAPLVWRKTVTGRFERFFVVWW
jgi:uncharacterized protein